VNASTTRRRVELCRYKHPLSKPHFERSKQLSVKLHSTQLWFTTESSSDAFSTVHRVLQLHSCRPMCGAPAIRTTVHRRVSV